MLESKGQAMDDKDLKEKKNKPSEQSKKTGVKSKLAAGTKFIHKTAHMIKEATEQFRLDAEYENPDRPEDVRYDDIVTPLGISTPEEPEPAPVEADAVMAEALATTGMTFL